jgi:hypothetical protein
MTLLASLQFENVSRPWLWIGLAILCAVVLWRTYHGIFQRSQRQLTWGLLALRAAGVAALLLSLAAPAWESQRDRVDPGRLAVVVDDSASMSLADPSGTSRYALARQAVSQLREALDEQPGPPLYIDLFDVQGRPLEGELPDEPRGERTDLARAVAEATRHLRSRPLAGVVLVSDGMDNTGRQDLEALADTPVPIYAVGFEADADASRLDLAVARVTSPSRAMVNNTVQVEVLVSKSSGPAVQANVKVRRGQTEFAAQAVDLPAGNVEQLVSLSFAPREAGRFVFTASVAAQAGERQQANNARHFPLQVDARPIRVLYVEGFLRDEFKFLSARLRDDPDVSLVTVVRRANPAEAGGAVAGSVVTPERLQSFDVVVLGDMEAGYLATAEFQALVDWLEGSAGEVSASGSPHPDPLPEGEGTEVTQPAVTIPEGPSSRALLVLGGYLSFGADGFRGTPLAAALPVDFLQAEPLQSEEPFVPELTAAGQDHPIFRVTGDRVRDAALWAGVPPLLGMPLVAREKPGAEVLARNPAVQLDGRPAVVVAAQRYGAGRTLLVAADTTWRWSRLARVAGQPDVLYARFWSQAIRWLAGREEDPERPRLIVSTDRPDYEVGKPVAIRAIRQPQPGEAPSAVQVTVDVTDETGRSTPVELRSTSGEPDVFAGVFYPATGGKFDAAATLMEDGQVTANQTTEFLVQGADLELADPGTNRARLQALADATGGVYADAAEAGQLAGSIERRERRTVEVQRSDWNEHPWLFLAFLAAVASEWVIRRRNHLV